MEKIIAKCVPEANIAEICAFGDKDIDDQVKFQKKNKIINNI